MEWGKEYIRKNTARCWNRTEHQQRRSSPTWDHRLIPRLTGSWSWEGFVPAPASTPPVTGGLVYPGDQLVTLPVEKSFVFSQNPPLQCCLSLGARQVLPSCHGVAPRYECHGLNLPPPRETTPRPTNISCRNLFLLKCDTHPGSWGFWGALESKACGCDTRSYPFLLPSLH